jgi:alpha-1,2-mannosyltransferase
MAAIWQEIRTGAWLTPTRLRGYSVILLAAYVIASVIWIALAHGLVDRNNKPLGTDFSNVYAAGTLTLAGKADVAYDWPSEHAVENATFGQDVPFFGWHYPPQFLMMAAVLALVPYGWALALWMAATLSTYVVVIRAIVPRPMTVLVALAYPAVFVNLGHGQNGFISAALLGGALLLLDRHPLVSGALIGLLAYKPQFGVLIPLVLLATARWTVIAAAAGTVFATCVATLAMFGTKVWVAFAASATLTRQIVLEEGGTGWEKIQSVFSTVRMWGGSIDLAYAAQGGIALGLAAVLIWLWRSEAAFDLKAAALADAVLIATPYVLDYDLMMLAVAIAFYARHGLARGFHNFELSLLAFVWIAPLLTRPLADATGIPLGLIAQIVLFIMALGRAHREITLPHGNVSLVQA